MIEPKSLQAKETVGSGSASAETAAAATSAAGPRDSMGAGAPQTSSAETIPYQSLGEIARAHRNDARAQVTTVPEKGELEESKRSEEVEHAKTPAIDAVSAKSALDGRTRVSVAAAAPAMVKKSETLATRQSTASSAPTKVPQTAKNEVTAVPQAQPNTIKQGASLVTAEPVHELALKVEASLPAPHTASPRVPAVQGPLRTEMLASANGAPKEQVAASPAASATLVPPTSKPEPSLTVGLAVSRHLARSTTKRDNQKPARARKGDGDLSEFQDMAGLLVRMLEDIAKL